MSKLFIFISLLLASSFCSKVLADKCSLDLERGLCFGEFFRYGFDTALKRCRSFEYGGCGGNENNFLTMRECEISCPAPTPY